RGIRRHDAARKSWTGPAGGSIEARPRAFIEPCVGIVGSTGERDLAPFACLERWHQTLFGWDFRVDDWRDYAIHMIFVAQQTVLARHAAGVTALTEILFHRAKIGHKTLRIALLVALQIGAASFKVVAGQATAILHDAEMRPVDEVREASLFGLNRRRSEINEPPPALDIVNAVTFRA